jgi:lipopolysaccharide export system protein LptA
MRKQHSKKSLRLFLGAFLGILYLTVCHVSVSGAQNKSPLNLTNNEKIKITADNLSVDNKEKYAEFSGNVKAQQGKNKIRSDSLRIYYKGDLDGKNKKEAPGDKKKESATGQDVIEKAVASGNVKISFDDKVAVSDVAEFINGKQMLILSGPNTKFISGNNSIAGERITIHIETGKVNIEGTKKNRVEAVFYPGDKGGIQ